MLDKHNDSDFQSSRLTLNQLRKIEEFSKVSDEDGQAIITDALSLARMILDIID
jgi:hypothetical protein